MTANTRHVPGSIRSRRSVLSRSTIPFRRFQTFPEKSVQNPYKSDHFHECEFFTSFVAITYNFNALKCTDFPAAGTPLRRRPHFGGACSIDPGTFWFLLPRGEGQDEGQTGNGLPFVIAPSLQIIFQYCTESATSPICYRSDHAVPTTYANSNRRTPIFETIRGVCPLCVRYLYASLRFLRPFFVPFVAFCKVSRKPKSSKSAHAPISADFDHAVPGTYNKSFLRAPILSFVLRHSFVIRHSEFVIGTAAPFPDN